MLRHDAQLRFRHLTIIGIQLNYRMVTFQRYENVARYYRLLLMRDAILQRVGAKSVSMGDG